MATRGIDIGIDWVEVSSTLNMLDGTSYVVEMQGAPGVVVYAHDNRDADSDPDENSDGHIWLTINASGGPQAFSTPGPYRSFSMRPGWQWWLRVSGSPVRCVISELS